MEFHGAVSKFHEIPWNSLSIFSEKLKVIWGSFELGSMEKNP